MNCSWISGWFSEGNTVNPLQQAGCFWLSEREHDAPLCPSPWWTKVPKSELNVICSWQLLCLDRQSSLCICINGSVWTSVGIWKLFSTGLILLLLGAMIKLLLTSLERSLTNAKWLWKSHLSVLQLCCSSGALMNKDSKSTTSWAFSRTTCSNGCCFCQAKLESEHYTGIALNDLSLFSLRFYLPWIFEDLLLKVLLNVVFQYACLRQS